MKKIKHLLGAIFFGIVYSLAAILCVLCRYVNDLYGVGFRELLYTLSAPIKGTSSEVIALLIETCVPPILFAILMYIVCAFLLCQGRVEFPLEVSVKKHTVRFGALRLGRRLGALACVTLLIFAWCFADDSLDVSGYVLSLQQRSTLYETYYVDPYSVSIECTGTPKNVIYICLESMETTYASVEDGGKQPVNYIPELTALARENTSFSDKVGLGGFQSPSGTGWTMGALLAFTSGVPFQFPVGGNDMDQTENFATRLKTIGNILADKGYRQEFLCGSDGDFAGRKQYFERHGDYYVLDYYEAIRQGYIPPDYNVWWGFEDKYLYGIAKEELLKLSTTDQPFNFTMLTVDPHHAHGYLCSECEDIYDTQLANVLNCADRQVVDFVGWCRQQDFYDNTVIIITGDHPRMDTDLVNGIGWANRTVYNCFINAEPKDELNLESRLFTSMDMFPTTLGAMGFEIEGNRLGLGTNLFSDRSTLAEEIGIDTLNNELTKYSPYYILNFS